MPDLLDCLYAHALDEMEGYLDTPAHRAALGHYQAHYKALRDSLDEGQLAHLSGLMDADGEVDSLEHWALFRAGLSMGAALGRL